MDNFYTVLFSAVGESFEYLSTLSERASIQQLSYLYKDLLSFLRSKSLELRLSKSDDVF